MRRTLAVLLLCLLSLPAFAQGRTMGRAQPALTLAYVLAMGAETGGHDFTLTEGDQFLGTATGSSGTDSIFDFLGTNSGTGTHAANIVNIEWAGAGGSGTKRGLRINAPTGFVGDGLWFGVNGAEKFVVSSSGAVQAQSVIATPSYFTTDTTSGAFFVWGGGNFGSTRGQADDGMHFVAYAADGTMNNNWIFTNAASGSLPHGNTTPSATPTIKLYSDETVSVSNQEWGSAAHDGGDFVLSAGPATGAGSAPTTIRNAVRIDANFVTTEQSGGDNQAATLGAGATTVAITTDFLTLTGDGGGNTVATITGGITGQTLRILCVDALVAITDTDAHTADTVDLSAAFTCADDTVLTLLSNGTSWYETGRSVN